MRRSMLSNKANKCTPIHIVFIAQLIICYIYAFIDSMSFGIDKRAYHFLVFIVLTAYKSTIFSYYNIF